MKAPNAAWHQDSIPQEEDDADDSLLFEDDDMTYVMRVDLDVLPGKLS